MKRLVEMFEVSFAHHVILSANEADATAAAAALSRCAYVSSACNPCNLSARIDLAPIEPKLRRVFLPASEKICVTAFGNRLKAVQTPNAERRTLNA